MANIPRATIMLDDREYRLARQEMLAAAGLTARRWQEEKLPIATQTIKRPDVQPGEIPREFVIAWDDWSNGIWGDRDAPPNVFHFSHGVDTRFKGRAFPAFKKVTTNISTATYPFDRDPVFIGDFDGDTYLLAGRYAFTWADGAWVLDKMFYKSSYKYGEFKYGEGTYGAGYDLRIVDAIVFDNKLLVSVEQPDGADDLIWVKSGGAWTRSEEVDARHFTIVHKKLWKSDRRPTVTIAAGTNDDYEWDDIDQAEANYSQTNEISVTITAGTYTEAALANALETAINAGAGILGSYTVEYDAGDDRFTIARSNSFIIIAGTNDDLDFTEATSGDATATMTAGSYTGATLATEIQTKVNAAASDNTYTCTYTISTRKFTIARATGSDAFGLEWKTGPNGSDNLNTHIGNTIGFEDNADDTGAITYTSDNNALEFSILWKTGAVGGSDGADTHCGTVLGFLDAADDTSEDSYVGDGAPSFSITRSISRVSNLGLGDDPSLYANWSAPIDVGDRSSNITDLNSIGPRVLVSKEEGLFAGDELGIFPNILPDVATAPDADNGTNTFVRGSEIFYPFIKGLKSIEWSGAPVADEVGPNINFTNSINEAQPGMHPTAICADGEWVFIATEPTIQETESAMNQKFLLTKNGGSSYTDYDSATEYHDNSNSAVLDSLDTWANGDAFLIGDSSRKFYGVYFQIKNSNTTSSTLIPKYWNGSFWSEFKTVAPDYNAFTDYTSVDGVTLSRSQAVFWAKAPTDWEKTTLNYVSAYWIRFEVSAALSATVDITAVEVLTNPPRCYIMAGRRVRQGDYGSSRYIWHILGYTEAPRVTALHLTNNVDGNPGKVLIAGAKQKTDHYFLEQFATQPSAIRQNSSAYLYLCKHSGDSPHKNKEWIEAKIYGKGVTDTSLVRLYYRVDEDTAWTAVGDALTSVPATINFNTELGAEPTGYTIQLAILFDVTLAKIVPPEISRIEIRYRELPTYKSAYRAILEIGDHLVGSGMNQLPAARVQLLSLENDMGAAISLTDPVGRAKTVTVTNLNIMEVSQSGLNYPVLLAEIKMMEA